MYLFGTSAFSIENGFMKTILTIIITLTFGYAASAQDTLSKKIVYDLTIEAASKTSIPWLQNYIQVAGGKHWLERLLDDFESGKLIGYEATSNKPVNPKMYIFEVDPYPDTVYVIDPITYEEKIEIVYATSLKQKNIKAIRVNEEWKWNEELKILERSNYAFAPVYNIYDNQGNYRGQHCYFWIKLD